MNINDLNLFENCRFLRNMILPEFSILHAICLKPTYKRSFAASFPLPYACGVGRGLGTEKEGCMGNTHTVPSLSDSSSPGFWGEWVGVL
jgi:hypothetical protein